MSKFESMKFCAPGGVTVTIEGREFCSLASACRWYSVDRSKIDRLLAWGVDAEEAILSVEKSQPPVLRDKSSRQMLDFDMRRVKSHVE